MQCVNKDFGVMYKLSKLSLKLISAKLDLGNFYQLRKRSTKEPQKETLKCYEKLRKIPNFYSFRRRYSFDSL